MDVQSSLLTSTYSQSRKQGTFCWLNFSFKKRTVRKNLSLSMAIKDNNNRNKHLRLLIEVYQRPKVLLHLESRLLQKEIVLENQNKRQRRLSVHQRHQKKPRKVL